MNGPANGNAEMPATLQAASPASKEVQPGASLTNWIDLLRCLYPISCLTHVGAGQGGDAALYRQWGLANVILLEADDGLSAQLSAAAAANPDWSTRCALLADAPAEIDFHLASNPNENSTTAPTELTAVWRNLRLRQTRRVTAVTLEAVWQTTRAPVTNWLVVDCLPALPVLRGIGPSGQASLDVILVRVGLADTVATNRGLHKAEIDTWLDAAGFDCLAFDEERHPAIGRAVYARRWRVEALRQRHLIAQLTLAQDEQTKAKEALDDELDRLRQAKNATDLALHDRESDIARLSAARDELERLAADRAAQMDLANQALSAQAELAANHRRVLEESLRLATAGAEQLARDQANRIAQLTREKEEQTASANDHAQHRARAERALSEQLQLLADGQEQLATLKLAKADAERTMHDQARLIAQLTSTIQQSTTSATDVDAELQQCRKAQEDSTRQIAALKAELEEYRGAAADAQIEAHDRQLRQDQLNEVTARQAAHIADLAVQLEQYRQAQRERSDTRDNDNLQTEIWANLEADLKHLREAHAAESNHATTLAQELVELRKTLSLSIRQQSLTDADLRDLQSRYGELLTKYQHQTNLLAKLAQRLTLANQYVSQLGLRHLDVALAQPGEAGLAEE